MINPIDHHNLSVAKEIYEVQQVSYVVEQALIDYPNFPPLQVTVADIQQEDEIFLGYRVGERLAGVLSFATSPTLLDIGRLIVHPDFFRLGIASQLLTEVESIAGAERQITVSTAEKNLPAVQLYHKQGYQLTQRKTLPDGLVLVRFHKQPSRVLHAMINGYVASRQDREALNVIWQVVDGEGWDPKGLQ